MEARKHLVGAEKQKKKNCSSLILEQQNSHIIYTFPVVHYTLVHLNMHKTMFQVQCNMNNKMDWIIDQYSSACLILDKHNMA